MDNKFYEVSAKLSYGRSPVKIQSIVAYDTLAPLDENSVLVQNNLFRVDSGKKWHDVVQFADSFLFAISERVKQLLEANEISGWGSFPIQIEEHTDKEYHAFYVTSVVGEIQNLEALNNYETDIHEFDIETWKKTDFFTNEGTLNIVCAERAKNILEKGKVSNIEFEKY